MTLTRILTSASAAALALIVVALPAGFVADARAQSSNYPPGFPSIPIWAWAGDFCGTCGPDSVVERPRAATVRFKRDRRAEARSDFAGYRIYRSIGAPDTSRMMLIRRFSQNPGSDQTWTFSRVDTATLEFRFGSTVAHDSIVTFVDPDDAGNFVKVCRLRDELGRCLTPGDSIFVIEPPPGPHDGFATYYSITYEALNGPDIGTYEDLYVAGALRDTSGNYQNCGTVGDSLTCPFANLNLKDRNLAAAVFPTRGPTVDLEQVRVVPNPFRGSEVWDVAGANEIHFINLPAQAKIQIFTASGDLVTEIQHNDTIHDFERWNLKNGKDQPVASGIYVFRVTAEAFAFQNRFVVIR